MDKPTTPAGPNANPWPDESDGGQGFGATGVFQTVKGPEPLLGSAADPMPDQSAPGNRAGDGGRAGLPSSSTPMAEPVVHKVVPGSGPVGGSTELLERIRLASAEKTPAGTPGEKGSGGFTELLRTLESEKQATPKMAAPATEIARPISDTGFSSLLRTLNSAEPAAGPAEQSKMVSQPAALFTQDEPKNSPTTPAPGSFTQMLQTASAKDSAVSGPPTFGLGMSASPAGSGAPSSESKPGTFTQLFGSLSGADASSAVPAPSTQVASDSSRESAGSFTRMLSLEPPTTPVAPPAFQEPKPASGSVDYGHTPTPGGTGRPAEASGDPFAAQPVSDVPAMVTPPQAGGVGITRLIQMLDEPAKAPPPPRREEPPPSPTQGPGPGVWTQTFASLGAANQPPAPAGKSQEYPPAQPAPPAAAFPPPPEVHPSASISSAPSAAAGPSEFTRILDASRIREMAMRGGQLPAAELPAGSAAPPLAPMPSYPVPVVPPAVGMQGGGGVPRPVVYPPQVPQAPAVYVPPPPVSQAPGMYVPPPMAAPPPAAKPASTPAGKLQQLVPVLLIVVIVLLVVLIVTVLFLMKH